MLFEVLFTTLTLRLLLIGQVLGSIFAFLFGGFA